MIFFLWLCCLQCHKQAGYINLKKIPKGQFSLRIQPSQGPDQENIISVTMRFLGLWINLSHRPCCDCSWLLLSQMLRIDSDEPVWVPSTLTFIIFWFLQAPRGEDIQKTGCLMLSESIHFLLNYNFKKIKPSNMLQIAAGIQPFKDNYN